MTQRNEAFPVHRRLAWTLIALGGGSLAAGCETISPYPAKGPSGSTTQFFTFVSAPGTGCASRSTRLETEQESLITDLAAPILGGLFKGAFDAVGGALKSASEARSKQWTTPASPVFVAQFNYERGTIPSFYTAYKSFCVTALAADISRTAVPVPEAISAEALGDTPTKDAIERYIRSSLGPERASHIGAIRFYTEIEVRLDASSSLQQVYYQAQPAFTYFERPITGDGFKLAAIQIDLGSVFEPSKSVWSHTFSLISNPMVAGDLRVVTVNPIQASGLLPVPPIATAEVATMKAMQDAATALKATYGATPPSLSAEDAARLAKLRADVLALQRAAEDEKCKADNPKDPEKTDACLKSLAAARAYADASSAILLKRQQDDINASIQALRGPQDKVSMGPYNVSVTLTETRDANALGLAVAKILTDAKPATDTAINTYVNGQLGVTPDASLTPALNAYRLARFDFDQAKLAYDAAKAKGDAADITAKQRAMIEKYNELLLKAEAAGERVTIASPY